MQRKSHNQSSLAADEKGTTGLHGKQAANAFSNFFLFALSMRGLFSAFGRLLHRYKFKK